MIVTVLGATGRTGRLLVAELTGRGHEVTIGHGTAPGAGRRGQGSGTGSPTSPSPLVEAGV